MKRAFTATGLVLLLLQANTGVAIDSYRYLHVSIETPWMIFLFLLIAVFIPFVLMVVLMWRQMHKPVTGPKPKDPAP